MLDLVIRGLGNRQIAERLGLSGKTVANHVSTLLVKCGATDRVELGRIARAAIADTAGSGTQGQPVGMSATAYAGVSRWSRQADGRPPSGAPSLPAFPAPRLPRRRAASGRKAPPELPIVFRLGTPRGEIDVRIAVDHHTSVALSGDDAEPWRGTSGSAWRISVCFQALSAQYLANWPCCVDWQRT